MPKSDPPNRRVARKPAASKSTAPKPDVAVHGGQWGSSGKQGAVDAEKAERLEPARAPRPARKQT